MNFPSSIRGKNHKALPFIAGCLLAGAFLLGSVQACRAQKLTYVRMLHGLTNGPKVDFYLDGKKHLNDQNYGDISKYLRLPNGRHHFQVRASEAPHFSPLSDYRSSYGDFFTVVPYGTVSNPHLLVLREDAGRPMRQWMNHARVFVCNLSPSARRCNVRISYNGGRFRPFIRSLNYGQVKTAYSPAGTATVQVRVGTNVVRTVMVNMRPGRRHSMFLIGKIGSTAENSAFKLIHEDAASQ
jgi:hypothetical protein